jgi:hypothetical protein
VSTQFNTIIKGDSKNDRPPVQGGTSFLLTNQMPKPEELLQHLEKNKVLIVDEAPKTIVDSTLIQATTDSIERQTNEQLKKRGLPEHVKKQLEESSQAFGNYAKETEKNANNKINMEKEEELWNRAIFQEEYPDGRKPLEVKYQNPITPFSVPKKQNSEESPLFPTRITAYTEKEAQKGKVIPVHPIITVLKPQEYPSKDLTNNKLSFSIPKKQESMTGNILPTQIATEVIEKNPTPTVAKNIIAEPVSFIVPKKPMETASQQIHLPRYEAKKNTETSEKNSAAIVHTAIVENNKDQK